MENLDVRISKLSEPWLANYDVRHKTKSPTPATEGGMGHPFMTKSRVRRRSQRVTSAFASTVAVSVDIALYQLTKRLGSVAS